VGDKRIEDSVSKTAKMTCSSRAFSYYENIRQLKTNDYIAPLLLPKGIQLFLKNNMLRKLIRTLVNPPTGIYEYVVARTKYIDNIFQKIRKEDFEQVLIFGAGFDSRGIRFFNDSISTKVFELDVPITQRAKLMQYEKRKIKDNNQMVYISIDFTKDSLDEKLRKADFQMNKKTLFLLEGILMYLDNNSVDETFNIIKKYAGKGSRMIFDSVYKSVIAKENKHFGETEIHDAVNNAREEWTFGLEPDEIQSFLKKFNFRLIEIKTTENLEQEFFIDDKGNKVSKINGTHFIAYAELIA